MVVVVRPPVSSLLSRDEIEEAIRSLPDAGWVRLHKVAKAYCRRRALEPEDLLQEAFRRAIDGSRSCPRNIDVVRFLAEAMRSIASDTADGMCRQPEFQAIPLIGDDGLSLDVPDREPTAETRLLSLEEVKRIERAVLDLFADDPIAEVIILGRMEGMDSEELRALAELDKTAFASKLRLIRRRIDGAFPKGWKP